MPYVISGPAFSATLDDDRAIKLGEGDALVLIERHGPVLTVSAPSYQSAATVLLMAAIGMGADELAEAVS